MASTCSSSPRETKLVTLRYADTLEPATRARYHEKIRLVGTDPYEMGESEWSADVSLWPEINYHDIFNYLVSKQSAHTREDFEDITSLTAYNHFLSGRVKNAGCVQKNELCLMSARVRPSQRMNGTPRRPWLIAERSGRVLAAHCDCTAVLGEACSHIGALLFSVEAGVKHSKSKSAGREKADWLLPSAVDNVPYAEVRDIDFTSAKSQKRLLGQTVSKSTGADAHKVSEDPLGFHQIPPPTEEELQQCFDKLLASGLKPAVLALDARYADRYLPAPPTQNSPQAMLEHKGHQCFTMTKEELMEQSEPSCEPPEDTPEHFFHAQSMSRGQADAKPLGDGDAEVMRKRRKV